VSRDKRGGKKGRGTAREKMTKSPGAAEVREAAQGENFDKLKKKGSRKKPRGGQAARLRKKGDWAGTGDFAAGTSEGGETKLILTKGKAHKNKTKKKKQTKDRTKSKRKKKTNRIPSIVLKKVRPSKEIRSGRS